MARASGAAPAETINHALVLSGSQGIGKDTLFEPVKRSVGPWNFREANPLNLLEPFNDFVKAVILRISEARDLGEFDRFKFYEHMKVYTAAPPDVLRVNEKFMRQYAIPNCCGVIITTNYTFDGIYLPADDRRHYVARSILDKADFTQAYWDGLWEWYDAGGDRHVAAYLAELDLSDFNAKAPPPKTQAFWEIVDANRSPESDALADALDNLERPDTVTVEEVACKAEFEFAEFLRDRKNARTISRRFEDCGYVAVRNDGAKDGRWVIDGKRRMIYARADLSIRERYEAVADRAKEIRCRSDDLMPAP